MNKPSTFNTRRFHSRFTELSLAIAVVVVDMWGLTAQAAVAPPDPSDLTIGDWSLLPARSKFCSPAPKASINHIFNAGFGIVVTEWFGMHEDGTPFMVRYVTRSNGEKFPADITKLDSSEGIAWKLVNPHHGLLEHYDKDGKLTSTFSREVSDDGQIMTQTTTFASTPCVVTAIFERR